jgi:hypothetical protein
MRGFFVFIHRKNAEINLDENQEFLPGRSWGCDSLLD